MPLRTFLRRLHLCLACSVGLIFVLSGLTGSIIVFDHAIDEALNPQLLLTPRPQPDATRLPYQTLLEKAEAHYRDRPYHIGGLQAPRVADSSQMFWVKSNHPDSQAAPLLEVYLNPYTGAVIGEREYGTYFTSYVYILHYTLLMGQTGKLILGYSAIGIVVMLFTGLYLWWPHPGQWRIALTVKRGARRLRQLLDWHRVAGIYGLLLMCITVFTGLSIIFSGVFSAAVNAVSPITPAPKPVAIATQERKGEMVNLDMAIATATRALEGSRFSRVYFAEDRGSTTWLMTYGHPHDPKHGHGYERLTIHPYTGQVVALRRWPQASRGDSFLAWLFPLHSGEALGLTGRWLVCFGGMLPLLLAVTGIWRWRRKQANRPVTRQSTLAPARG